MSRSPCLQFSSLKRRGSSAKSPCPCCWQLFRTRLRGGGAREPEALSCDAIVDVDMFLSEYGDDDKAEHTRGLMPVKTELLTGRLEDGWMQQQL